MSIASEQEVQTGLMQLIRVAIVKPYICMRNGVFSSSSGDQVKKPEFTSFNTGRALDNLERCCRRHTPAPFKFDEKKHTFDHHHRVKVTQPTAWPVKSIAQTLEAAAASSEPEKLSPLQAIDKHVGRHITCIIENLNSQIHMVRRRNKDEMLQHGLAIAKYGAGLVAGGLAASTAGVLMLVPDPTGASMGAGLLAGAAAAGFLKAGLDISKATIDVMDSRAKLKESTKGGTVNSFPRVAVLPHAAAQSFWLQEMTTPEDFHLSGRKEDDKPEVKLVSWAQRHHLIDSDCAPTEEADVESFINNSAKWLKQGKRGSKEEALHYLYRTCAYYNLLESLRGGTPYLIGVAGRQNAGKSTLVNALTESKVPDIGLTKHTSEVKLYKVKDCPSCYLADLPGLNSVDEAEATVCAQLSGMGQGLFDGAIAVHAFEGDISKDVLKLLGDLSNCECPVLLCLTKCLAHLDDDEDDDIVGQFRRQYQEAITTHTSDSKRFQVKLTENKALAGATSVKGLETPAEVLGWIKESCKKATSMLQ